MPAVEPTSQITMPLSQPTLHKPVPMGQRVRVPKHYLGKDATGTVEGISFMHVIFVYIVRLDEPHPSEHGEIRCITVGGADLDSEDGLTNWRLEP